MVDGPMSKVAPFPEEFAMISGYSNPGVFRHDVEHFFDNFVEILYRADLPLTKHFHLRLIKKLFRFALQLAAHYLIIQVFEDPMDAADTRPFFGRFVNKGI